MDDATLIEVLYTNWRGETSLRRVVPKTLRFGTSEWHPDPQYLLDVYDVDKKVRREFALKDCVFSGVADAAHNGPQMESLREEFLEELQVLAAAHADPEHLNTHPNKVFPEGWFLIKQEDRPIAMFPDEIQAGDHREELATQLAEAALGKLSPSER